MMHGIWQNFHKSRKFSLQMLIFMFLLHFTMNDLFSLAYHLSTFECFVRGRDRVGEDARKAAVGR